LSPVEYTTFWITVFAYALGSVLALTGLVFKRERLVTAAAVLCTGGLVVHCVAIGARIVHTGHLPVASRYENILTGAAVVMLFNMVAILRRRSLMPQLVFVAPFTLLMLGYGLLNQPRFTTMSLVLDNLWMFVHILFAWLAYGAYSVAAGVGTLYLLRGRKGLRELPREQLSPLMARMPDLPVLDDLMLRFIIFGFVAHVVMLEPHLRVAVRPLDPPEADAKVAGKPHGLAGRRHPGDGAFCLLGHESCRGYEALSGRPQAQDPGGDGRAKPLKKYAHDLPQARAHARIIGTRRLPTGSLYY
jgi:ABC-type uncharacterized transport system permease subunit